MSAAWGCVLPSTLGPLIKRKSSRFPVPGVVPRSRGVAIRSQRAPRRRARSDALGIRRARSSFLCYGVKGPYLWSCGTVTAVLQVAEFPAASMPW